MPTEDTEQRLAARLAELRVQRGWSLDELATATGISRASLSRIERSETSPTAALLNRLCVAYGLTMSRLLSEVEEGVDLLLTPEQQPLWRDDASGFVRRNVSPPAPHFRAELVEGQLRPGARIDYDAPPVQGLEQHIWLQQGGLTITMDGQSWTLQTGDCLRFHLTGRSAFEAHLIDGARYVLVVCKP
ncbi:MULTISPECIES: helix-turn-helix domain-containing protein [Pantoea]|uniref:Helix-turn-helix domain-containing protein n=1 Tax=Pantoea piersonii TaxID=2364647 RepID=A0AAJ5U8M8_9GAMM|nr:MULTISPECIES: helix-turn-helix transcriptional regulator [Pantoea]HCW99222.1 transcriptional regulator [Pantoea sp.]MBZ6386706.1 helix-turn-helix domain-containing protein [Pantoea piersonii]MBZ6399625.1 helix-turn-helix domain-containing protein [Pantoea piersonii]MBZ6407116.1 helix-turn-helix domain-containing protein [Pantoea piersonii]MBZ6425797.1 helix-turn-helix domain-containing protein [Pantoea piersonii]